MVTPRDELVPQKLKKLSPERHLVGQPSRPKSVGVLFAVSAETPLKGCARLSSELTVRLWLGVAIAERRLYVCQTEVVR